MAEDGKDTGDGKRVGNLSMYEEDRNSAVSTGNDEYTLSYTYEKNTSGRNAIRRDTMTLPSGASILYEYRAQPARFDEDVSRVTYLKHGATVVANYQYNGLGQVVETDYTEPDLKWSQYGSTSGDYPDLDRFNRVTSSRWTAYSGSETDFYDVDVTYDRNSNITVVEDNVHAGFDVDYSIDDVDRLTRAEEGTWGGSSISSRTRDEQWTLDQVGNWDVDKVDLNGDGDFVDAGELNDDRTHNEVNELTARDTDDSGTDDITLSYNAAGCMTDDGDGYKYVWDAFLRLREVYNQSDELVAEHRYNGLGHRIGELVDTDTDGDVDGNDEWRFFAHDERWRAVAHFMGSDTDPTEEYLFHAAGLDGSGGSSYIDLVVLRERDTTDNGTMDERVYYCQNWRADVSAIVDDSGVMQEWVKYSSYGVPFGLPAGDADSDGDCDGTDATQITAWKNAPAYDVRGDINLDGTVDASDEALVQSATLGRGNLSSIENRLGYAGYVWADSSEDYFVRHRVLSPGLGRWLSRDPAAYADGWNLYGYVGCQSISLVDPKGLCSESQGGLIGGVIGDCPKGYICDPSTTWTNPPGPHFGDDGQQYVLLPLSDDEIKKDWGVCPVDWGIHCTFSFGGSIKVGVKESWGGTHEAKDSDYDEWEKVQNDWDHLNLFWDLPYGDSHKIYWSSGDCPELMGKGGSRELALEGTVEVPCHTTKSCTFTVHKPLCSSSWLHTSYPANDITGHGWMDQGECPSGKEETISITVEMRCEHDLTCKRRIFGSLLD